MSPASQSLQWHEGLGVVILLWKMWGHLYKWGSLQIPEEIELHLSCLFSWFIYKELRKRAKEVWSLMIQLAWLCCDPVLLQVGWFSLANWIIFTSQLHTHPIACLRVMKWLNRIKQQSPRWWCWPLLSVTIGINYDSRKDNWWLGERTPKRSVETSETFQELGAFWGLSSGVINNGFSWFGIFG